MIFDGVEGDGVIDLISVLGMTGAQMKLSLGLIGEQRFPADINNLSLDNRK